MTNSFIKQVKSNIYLSDDDIKILERYDIDYREFTNMKELMFYIEDYINNMEYYEDLEDLLIKFSEYNYYFKTNK
ncbi:MAG: hypothetical protein IKN63_06005 [Bacilli bacterium]|nr:hypothetical protein [Bacilli bacterium]